MKFENFLSICNVDSRDRYDLYSIRGSTKFELNWKIKNAPWSKYVANTSIYNCGGDVPHIQKWCEENLMGKFDLCVPIYFELEEDCILFILKWC